MANPQNRTVALLDVDNTLLFGQQGSTTYNNNLIETLIENKVTDVYLFTSMTLRKRTIEERAELGAYLESKGLKVHGVICDSDLIWKKNKGLINEFYDALQTAEPDDLLKQEKYRSLRDFNDAIPGQAYAAVTAETNDAWTDEDATRYRVVSSAIRKYLDGDCTIHARKIAESEKAYLYQMVVINKPEWAGDVIFADDANNHIDGVSAMHKKLAPNHRLLTVYNQSKKENPKPFYQALIKPFVELLNLFNAYASERSYSYSSEKNQILDGFRKVLEGCFTLDRLEQVEQQYKYEYQELNTHRFSFWSEEKTRSATVFNEMFLARWGQIANSLFPVRVRNEEACLSTLSDENKSPNLLEI